MFKIKMNFFDKGIWSTIWDFFKSVSNNLMLLNYFHYYKIDPNKI